MGISMFCLFANSSSQTSCQLFQAPRRSEAAGKLFSHIPSTLGGTASCGHFCKQRSELGAYRESWEILIPTEF